MSQLSSPQKAQNPDALYHLGYVSTEAVKFSEEALVALLSEARNANADRDVTGLLLYREGSFYQVLEGSKSAVMATFHDIEGDPRHKEVRILFNGETDAREFADWKMGFLNLDGVDVEMLSGFSDFMTRDAQPQEFLENLSRGKRLALMFRTLL